MERQDKDTSFSKRFGEDMIKVGVEMYGVDRSVAEQLVSKYLEPLSVVEQKELPEIDLEESFRVNMVKAGVNRFGLSEDGATTLVDRYVGKKQDSVNS